MLTTFNLLRVDDVVLPQKAQHLTTDIRTKVAAIDKFNYFIQLDDYNSKLK